MIRHLNLWSITVAYLFLFLCHFSCNWHVIIHRWFLEFWLLCRIIMPHWRRPLIWSRIVLSYYKRTLLIFTWWLIQTYSIKSFERKGAYFHRWLINRLWCIYLQIIVIISLKLIMASFNFIRCKMYSQTFTVTVILIF